MPRFRPAVWIDARPVSPPVVRELCALVSRRSNFFIAPPNRLVLKSLREEILYWELFAGRLLDGSQTREKRLFEAWNVHLMAANGELSAEPIVAVKLDIEAGWVYVTRAIECYSHEPYDSGHNVILTRDARKWQRELVGSIDLGDMTDAEELLDELICLMFQAVVGTSRLPLASIETPLPGFALGMLGYLFRHGGGDPLTTPGEIHAAGCPADLAPIERVKHLELLIRATPSHELPTIAKHFKASSSAVMANLRAVFNAVTLSPYTDFVSKAFALIRHIADDTERADFLGHLLRQLARHLTAYDLVTFHHRGANYPDALLLDELLAELLGLAAVRPEILEGESRVARLRRRAIRHGLLLRLQYAGHRVPDAPTSPGENQRVLPEPFVRVPDEQIESPVTRPRKLFKTDLPLSPGLIRACFGDLDQPTELLELGTALFLDRPLGHAKSPGEPDQTWLASHVLVSRSIADARLQLLTRRPEWLPRRDSIERWRELLQSLTMDGVQLRNAGPAPRPGVVSLHDAHRIADDFVIVSTTRQAIREFAEQVDLSVMSARPGDAIPPLCDWRIIIPGGTVQGPTLCVYDLGLRLRLELAADMSGGYRTRGGVEFPRAGLRVLPSQFTE